MIEAFKKMKYKPSNTYVIGDIHGNYKGLVQCLKKCNFDYDNDVLISLGDIVDGFPQSYECVEELLKIKNHIAVQGNHDYMFLEFLKTNAHGFEWKHGSDSTASSYLINLKEQKEVNKRLETGWVSTFQNTDVPKHHKDFFESQLPYYIYENMLFVHGGFNRHFPLKEQMPFWFMWDRVLWMAAMSFSEIKSQEFKIKDKFDTIFIGHTKTTNWMRSFKIYENGELIRKKEPYDYPMYRYNIINIDTGGGGVEGKITIMDVKSKHYWQSDRASTLYPHHIPRK